MVMAELKYHLSRESLLKEQQLIQITKQANISVYMLDFYIKQTHLSTPFIFFSLSKTKNKIYSGLRNKCLQVYLSDPH
jgi:hypothetical protein